ncbi:Cytochrome P450, E-class, group IV [Fusarium oxysporum f. sp. vasinfectum]|nr:Cytochrome P450, E-class, group IV [Fusarium oxysporum f. sp. vasinfectum]
MESNTYGTWSWEHSPRSHVIATCALIFLLAWFARTLLLGDALANVPAVGKGTRWARRKQYTSGSPWDMYEEGHRMIKKGADYFRIATIAPGETIVVSSKFLPELKKLPDEVLSMSEAISEILQSPYTKVPPTVPGLPHIVKSSLTPALVRLNSMVAKEVNESMALEFPQSEDWTEVNINEKVLRVIAMVSGRVFVGPELCRNEEYIDAAVNYTIDVMTAAYIVSWVPQWLRPIVAPFLPQTKQLHKRLEVSISLLRPVITARQAASDDSNNEKPDDMLQWLMDSQRNNGEVNVQKLAEMQLAAIFAAIHTTSLVTTNAFYTLASMPEIVPVLQDDVKQALEATNGEFTTSSLQNMKKLDSFLKEILRFHTLGASSFNRRVIRPFNLSNGQHIPAGVNLELPAWGIAYDENIFPSPHTFDALRFYNLRQSKNDEISGRKVVEVVASSQFVGVGATSLTFGYGRHACPGRSFAANEIKMILATTLLHYDIKNPLGVHERHKNIMHGSHVGFALPEYIYNTNAR